MRFAGSQNILGWKGCIRIIQSNSWCRTQSSTKYLNFEACFIPQQISGFDFYWDGPATANLQHLGFKCGLYEGCLQEQEDGSGKKSHASSTSLLPFATSRALLLARLCGQLWAGPAHPPSLHSSSKNVSTLSNRENMHEWAAAVLWSQTNLSGCQGRNSGSPPFPSSLSLCMEMDLPLVIC